MEEINLDENKTNEVHPAIMKILVKKTRESRKKSQLNANIENTTESNKKHKSKTGDKDNRCQRYTRRRSTVYVSQEEVLNSKLQHNLESLELLLGSKREKSHPK